MPESARTAPLQFLLALFAGIVNRHQQRVIDFLVEENKILKAALGKKRVRFDRFRTRSSSSLPWALRMFTMRGEESTHV